MLKLDRVVVRPMTLKDLITVHKVYRLMSEDSKRFLHPPFLEFNIMNPSWLFSQVALIVCTIRSLKGILLRLHPSIVFIPLVAVNKRDDVIGFAMLRVLRRLGDGSFEADLGIGIRDDHRGKGLGSSLMNHLLQRAKDENISRVSLIVHTDNVKALKLYFKHGFRQSRILKAMDSWRGRRFDCLEMTLNLNDVSSVR